ncbi:M15 family metallopeptidase [Phytomonospora sp. NPDC050363]|uniref:M15 family metallopeptidase n=1 Tax=Phytomonospora sp. NPDC050363 TaxID=3155642 RepID=UPI0033CCB351
MILLSDPRIAAIPGHDNGEALIDLRRVGELRLDPRLADEDGMFARLREGVLDRLLSAQRSLPDGLRLLIVEAYRPPHLQRKYFESYRDELRDTYPDWDEDRLHVEASKYVSPPEVAPHGTGGTVDLTLCTAEGVELDMGTAVNDSPEASANACFTESPSVVGEARRNRDLLSAALRGAGMVNYPTEWWHWSHGDRYWAFTLNASHTRYGPVEIT